MSPLTGSLPTIYRYKPFVGSPHAWAIDEARAESPGTMLRLLDVGAARGEVGQAIRDARAGAAELTGVEIDPTAREAFAIAPVELLAPWLDRNPAWRLLRSARLGLARLWPGLLAFQLLARCRRS